MNRFEKQINTPTAQIIKKNRVRNKSAPYQLRQFIRKIYGLEQSCNLAGFHIYIDSAIGRV
jgi:hypothetical protein